MSSEAIQKYLDEEKAKRAALIARMRERIPPISDEEFNRRVAANYAKIMAESNTIHFDPATIGLREDELALTWSDVRPGYSDGDQAVKVVREAFDRGHGLIFLWGNFGQGKTLIGKILVARAHAAGRRAAYSLFLEAIDDIRRAFDEPERKTTALLDKIDWWTGRDVLFLDEFDKSNDTAWVQERKFQIVDRCYQRAIREEALTVIASNQGDDAVDGYIRSRLSDRRIGPVLHLNGTDGRLMMPDGWRH